MEKFLLNMVFKVLQQFIKYFGMAIDICFMLKLRKPLRGICKIINTFPIENLSHEINFHGFVYTPNKNDFFR